MKHVFFIMVHLFTLLFFIPGLLLTVPLHVIASVAKKK